MITRLSSSWSWIRNPLKNEQHEYYLEYNEILQDQRLTPTPSEKGAEETKAEPVYEDVDDDLTPVVESKVVGEQGDPIPELLLDLVDRNGLV